MDDMTRLRCEHKRIASMAADLTAVVSQERPPDPLEFLAFRREFGRMLAAHLAREDWVTYPRLLADAGPRGRGLATRLAAEAQAFSEAFRDYGRRWTTVCIAADWLGFREETLTILARLLHRVEVEDREFHLLSTQPPRRPDVSALAGR